MTLGLFLAIALIEFSASATTPGLKEYRSKTCGIQFLMPESWSGIEGPEAGSSWVELGNVRPCSVGLKPKNWDIERSRSKFNLPRYSVTVTVFKRDMRDVAFASGFQQVRDLRAVLGADTNPELREDDWVMDIRQGATPAEWVVTKCCRGIRATGFSRGWAKDGSITSVHPRRALLNNYRGTSALIEGDSHHEVVDLVTGTLAFRPPSPN